MSTTYPPNEVSQSWAARYVGIPYLDRGGNETGVDCWGLVRLVYLRELAIELPDYPYASSKDTASVAKILGDYLEDEHKPWRQVKQLEPFDVLVYWMGYRFIPTHVGLYLAPGRMLHAAEGSAVAVAPFGREFWKTRLMGAFRYVG